MLSYIPAPWIGVEHGSTFEPWTRPRIAKKDIHRREEKM
jgi:hypothetical protein